MKSTTKEDDDDFERKLQETFDDNRLHLDQERLEKLREYLEQVQREKDNGSGTDPVPDNRR